MKTKVYMREEKEFRIVDIADMNKPMVSEVMQQKWQRIINIIGKLLNVPSGLIMKINLDKMEVFLKSEDDNNPYKVGGSDTLGQGLYCETVIGRDEPLLIDDAHAYEEWTDNPDIKLGMISYYGLPIKWTDGSFFGTICVLDSHVNKYNIDYRNLMSEFCDSLERDLEILEKNSQLEFFALYDQLTTVYNRRKIESVLLYEYDRFLRTKSAYSIIIFDLDKFKLINDYYGHDVGDKVLISFSDAIRSKVRSVDIFGRWGGDEFLLVCPETTRGEAQAIIYKCYEDVIKKVEQVIQDLEDHNLKFDFSYGIASIESKYSLPDDIIKEADKEMYKMKEMKKLKQ